MSTLFRCWIVGTACESLPDFPMAKDERMGGVAHVVAYSLSLAPFKARYWWGPKASVVEVTLSVLSTGSNARR